MVLAGRADEQFGLAVLVHVPGRDRHTARPGSGRPRPVRSRSGRPTPTAPPRSPAARSWPTAPRRAATGRSTSTAGDAPEGGFGGGPRR
ncbi:hypothetical protein TN53_26255 [Streptomyces sp. WM6386]|nr:hypothetical protein TN53_26255 [Streptomyces sp. WM6386]